MINLFDTTKNDAFHRAKANFIVENLERHKGNGKTFWENIHNLIPNKKAPKVINLFDTTKNVQIPPQNIAGFLNEYFSNIGPMLAKNYKDEWTYKGVVNDSEMVDLQTNETEILNICKDIDTYKASAVEFLSSRILRDAFCAIPNIIATLMNLSLSSDIFPDSWKKGKIIPLFKGGDHLEVNNYRPISLLPLPGKIIKKIVHNRITKFLEEHSLLNERQGGFRRGHSTINTVACFTDDIYMNINNSRCTLATFIDLKKAFDTVDHEILLDKLKYLGIKGKLHSWLKSYLLKRTQRTLANGTISDQLPVVCGVPQGLILGPTLFNIYQRH